jgi:periplasmic copper chaperone A
MEFKTLSPIFKQMFKNLLLSCLAYPVMAESLQLTEGHVRAMPPGVPNSAAYFTLENHGPAQRLLSVTTNAAKEAQLHTLIEEEGLVKMRQVASYDIPSHGRLVLQPSANHIMLLGLTAPLSPGQEISLILTFDGGQTMDISLPVRKADSPSAPVAEQGEHHHH